MAKRSRRYVDDEADYSGGYGGGYGDEGNRGLLWYRSWGEAFDHAKWLCFMLIVGVPVGVALVWGVYREDNLFGVIGIAGRRAAGSMIQETTPVGESLLNGTQGNGFRPGKFGKEDPQPLRGN